MLSKKLFMLNIKETVLAHRNISKKVHFCFPGFLIHYICCPLCHDIHDTIYILFVFITIYDMNFSS